MKLIYINSRGESLDLLNNQNHFVLTGADNLHGVDLEYSESDSPYIDGTNVDNVRAMPRGIALTFQLVGDVQQALDLFTQYVKSKQVGTLAETNENGREIRIKGITKVPSYTRVSAACTIQLELYCGQPYWEDLSSIVTEINDTISLLYLPATGRPFPPEGIPFGALNITREETINNTGDTSVGMVVRIVAEGSTTKPRISCSTGTQSGWYMELNVAVVQGDEIVITTGKGQKDITLNGLRTYNGTPLIQLLTVVGDDWLQLEQGDNTFNITATNPTLVYFTLEYRRRYE